MEFREFKVPAPKITPVGNGTVVYSVPTSPLPEAHRLALVHADEADPNKIGMVTLSIPRDRVAAYAAWMAECGGSDREPTPEELNAIMKAAGSILAHMQLDVFAALGDMFIGMLGDGDHDAALERVAESFAARQARKDIAKGKNPTEANADAEALAEMLRSLIERHRQQDGEGEVE